MLFIISIICLLIIAATMLARAHDLRWQKGWHWNFRLVGFILVGSGSIGVIGYDLWHGSRPNFYEIIFRFGLALVFVTTPYLPPWWQWISGKNSDGTPWVGTERRNKN